MASARNNRRRRRGRGRFGPLFKLLCALAVIVALTMGATVFFQVETVEVFGNSRYSREEIVEAAGIQVGDNLYHMNKYKVAEQLRQTLPYIGEVSIDRRLPSTIVITVSEWSAVARVKAPVLTGGSGTDATSGEEEGAQGAAAAVAREDWLISVGGKLLEPAPAGSSVMEVSGITPIMPRAGTMLSLPEEEGAKREALLSLLDSLEELEMLKQVSSVELGSTQLMLRYKDRFDVKLLLNADFNYKLRALDAAVTDTEQKMGDRISGTFDLTREEYAIYSPE